MLGYPKNLYLLPFDHRSSFIESFFGSVKKLTPAQLKTIQAYKGLIFEAFLSAIKKTKFTTGVPAILVDEEFGLPILKAAKKKKVVFLLPVEKSGQQIFSFAHGRSFGTSIKSLKPDIVKALVRFHPSIIKDKNNQIQLQNLATLSSFCQTNNYKLMIELLVPPSSADLKKFKNNREAFDRQLRPALTVQTIKEFQSSGIEPDIWKIEAMERSSDWPKVITAIRSGEKRQSVSIIMLGRGESFAKVKKWMDAAPKSELNGFAVGRTVFLRPLIDLHSGAINKKQAIQQIAKNYLELVHYWQR
ncbi:MAG TPA: DUF2090 domain-containing protein [Patescibacteria group bacterium]|nr:DUF2090 domain-containing protein [Patescibacteria group bacterium]